MCESMFVPTKTNWLDLLRAADALDLHRLRIEVMGFLRDNVDSLLSFDHTLFQSVTEEFPALLSDILTMRMITHPQPPSQTMIDGAKAAIDALEKEQAKIEVPWMALFLLVVGGFLYQYAVRVVSMGPMVPVVNSAALIGLLYYGYTVILKSTSSS